MSNLGILGYEDTIWAIGTISNTCVIFLSSCYLIFVSHNLDMREFSRLTNIPGFFFFFFF